MIIKILASIIINFNIIKFYNKNVFTYFYDLKLLNNIII